MKAGYNMPHPALKVKVTPHQTQQAADLVDGSYAAEEAHGQRQGSHSD